MVVFTRYMEVGRVVLINHGPDAGKLATVVDVVDQNKCLVDGPNTGVARQVIPFKRIMLTDLTVKVQRNARQRSIIKAWEEGGTMAKWESTSWAKKLRSRSLRSGLTDFDRFKAMVARKQRSEILAKKVAELS
jgi:large subunit ribosomal protein L14e